MSWRNFDTFARQGALELMAGNIRALQANTLGFMNVLDNLPSVGGIVSSIYNEYGTATNANSLRDLSFQVFNISTNGPQFINEKTFIDIFQGQTYNSNLNSLIK